MAGQCEAQIIHLAYFVDATRPAGDGNRDTCSLGAVFRVESVLG